MAIVALSLNNKNQYRRYPLKQGGLAVSDDGHILADTVIVNCSITSTYGRHRLYIKQIHYKDQIMRVALASVFDDIIVGVFTGEISAAFTSLKLTPFVRFISGSLTIGSVDSLSNIARVLNFTKDTAELEESTIFCYTPPAVTSISDKKNSSLRGYVEFGSLTSLSKTTTTVGTDLTATNPDSVFNRRDKSSFLGNCPTSTIRTINEVTPFTSGEGSSINDGNIYIAGVKPVIFFNIPGELDEPTPGIIGVDTGGVTLDRLCTQKHKLLPPVDVSGFTLTSLEYKNMYYSKPALPASPEGSLNYPLPRPERLSSNFNATTKPEYYYWPQFVKEEYYSFWATPKN
jgi:hypothetical protein